MTEFEKMLAGDNFDCGDKSVDNVRENAFTLLNILNQTFDADQRDKLLSQLMGQIPDTAVVRSPFYCEFGKNIFIGKSTFILPRGSIIDAFLSLSSTSIKFIIPKLRVI